MKIKNFSDKPLKKMVVLGESHVRGSCATNESNMWVRIVADLISLYQGYEIELHNKGISASVISRRSPGYEASIKPCAVDRYEQDVISLNPDLFLLSYGLNDMRAGMHPEEFRQDMNKIILEVKNRCNPVIVLTSVYYMTDYTLYPPFNKGSICATETYNLVIRQLAEVNSCILADIWNAEGMADWMIHPDTVHANDLGHRIIGNRVFEAVAKNCSCLSATVERKSDEHK